MILSHGIRIEDFMETFIIKMVVLVAAKAVGLTVEEYT